MHCGEPGNLDRVAIEGFRGPGRTSRPRDPAVASVCCLRDRSDHEGQSDSGVPAQGTCTPSVQAHVRRTPDAGDECRLRFAASASLSFPFGITTRMAWIFELEADCVKKEAAE